VRPLLTNWRASNGKTYLETLRLFFVTLIRNTKSQEIFKLNSLNTESTPRCCNCALTEGDKSHPASYRGCSHAKGELQRRRAQRAPKGPTGRTFFSKFTSPQQSYAAALHQDTQHQQPQTTQTEQ
jgi:hypothetical protein